MSNVPCPQIECVCACTCVCVHVICTSFALRVRSSPAATDEGGDEGGRAAAADAMVALLALESCREYANQKHISVYSFHFKNKYVLQYIYMCHINYVRVCVLRARVMCEWLASAIPDAVRCGPLPVGFYRQVPAKNNRTNASHTTRRNRKHERRTKGSRSSIL